MRTRQILCALAVTAALGGFSTAAQANPYCPSQNLTLPTADFAGNCTRVNNTVYCSFDALRDTWEADPSVCPNSSIVAVLWDFGDGTSYWDDTTVTHTFNNVHLTDGSSPVNATIVCANDCNDDHGRLVVFVAIGCPGCINMGTGWD